jgi:hypothetical protein
VLSFILPHYLSTCSYNERDESKNQGLKIILEVKSLKEISENSQQTCFILQEVRQEKKAGDLHTHGKRRGEGKGREGRGEEKRKERKRKRKRKEKKKENEMESDKNPNNDQNFFPAPLLVWHKRIN